MDTNHTMTDSHDNANTHGLAATPELENARAALTQMNERAMQFVRDQPVVCMAAALGVGFIVAKIADRF